MEEYEGKEIFGWMGVGVGEGGVGFSGEEGVEKGKELNWEVYVVKGEIEGGGRGKGGGVKIGKWLCEVER